jgi:hypothetical protein
LAVFQGASEDPYLTDTGRESNAEKQPTGSGPEGCDENGPTAALLVGYVSIEDTLPPRALPAALLIATKYLLFRGQDTRSLIFTVVLITVQMTNFGCLLVLLFCPKSKINEDFCASDI